MPTTTLMPVPKQQYFAIAGIPLFGGKVYTYDAGGSNPRLTYTDSAGTIPQANPIILNGRGEPNSPIFWSGAYRVEVRDALNNLVYSVDDYNTDPAGIWGLAAQYLTSAGASLIGFIQSGVGAVKHTVQDKLRERVSVFDFMTDIQISDARGTTTTGSNHTAAIQAAIDSLNQTNKGGIVFFPRGRYTCTAMLTVPWTGAGIILQGEAGVDQSGDGVATIYGLHTQDAIVSLQGSVFCQVNNICLDGGTNATFPKTALLLGRNGAGSAGWHSFDHLDIIGRFSVAAHYNVASEGNTYRNCFMNIDAGSTAAKVMYLSAGDSGGLAPVTPLTGSTLLGAEFENCHFYHMALTAGISCIYIDGSVSLGSIAFRGGYLVQANGHFVTIRSGTIDGKDTMGAITFDGVGGERPGGVGVPISGFNLFASIGAPVYLRGLRILGCRFLMAAGNYILQDVYVKLANAAIMSQGVDGTIPAALVNRPSQLGIQRFGLATVNNGECLDCLIDVGGGFKVEGTNQAVLLGTWVQAFSTGNGYGVVGYYKDLTGHGHLTGAPNGGVSGTAAFTLPVGYRPTTNKMFTVTSNTSTIAGQGDTTVFIEAATGNVVITGGVAPCYLSGVVFPTFA